MWVDWQASPGSPTSSGAMSVPAASENHSAASGPLGQPEVGQLAGGGAGDVDLDGQVVLVDVHGDHLSSS